jgi:hypothetical protein
MADEAPSLPEAIVTAIRELVDVLAAHQAHYALIGGLAAGLRGRVRSTEDIDLLLTVPQLRLPALLEALVGRGFTCDVLATVREWTQHHMVVLGYRGVRIDWLKPVLPLYQHVLDRAEPEEGFGRTVRVATAEGLILLKLIASRTQDVADVEALLAANQGRLDLAWVEQEWRAIFPADDPRWQRFGQLVAEFYERRPGPA